MGFPKINFKKPQDTIKYCGIQNGINTTKIVINRGHIDFLS